MDFDEKSYLEQLNQFGSSLNQNELIPEDEDPLPDISIQEPEDDQFQDFIAKQNELKHLGDLRMKTLESMLSEKTREVALQQDELDRFIDQNNHLKNFVDEKMQIIADYEGKFEKLKTIMHQKEVNISDLRAQVQTQDEQMMVKEKKIEQLQNNQLDVQKQLRLMQESINEKLEQQQSNLQGEAQREIKILKQSLMEKDKRMEIMSFEASEHLKIKMEEKDKEIRQIQESLAETYQSQQLEIDGLTSHVRQLQTDLQLKHSYSENVKTDFKAKIDMLEKHLAKMQEMLDQKSQLNEDLDHQNKAYLDTIGQLKRTIQELTISKTALSREHQYELDNMASEYGHKNDTIQQLMSDRENALKNEHKLVEKERERLLKELNNIKQQIKMKESSVKNDLEKIWSEWQEKYDELEADLQETSQKLTNAEIERKKMSKELQEIKKQNRQLQTQLKEKENEIQIVQDKYEEMLEEARQEKQKEISKNKEVEDALQYEIDFFKKELARQAKLGKQVYSASSARDDGTGSFKNMVGELATPVALRNQEETDPHLSKMDAIVAKAQASIKKVILSPFGGKEHMANDSLDAMRQDFMQDYQKIMRESGETFFNNEHPALTAQKQSQVRDYQFQSAQKEGGPLSQMLAAGQLYKSIDPQNLKVENEQLKAMIEIMKEEMNQVLNQVKNTDDPQSNLILQREIISKERKCFDLERVLRQSQDDLRKLREERDRLIHISSELRAELNKVKRGQANIIKEDSKEDLMTSRQTSPQNSFKIVQQDQQKQLQNLGVIVSELAEQMRDFVNQSTKPNPPKNNFTANKYLPGSGYLKRPKSVKSKHSKEVTPITKSLSPDSKLRKKGQEFIQKIDDLKKDLEIQGNQLNLIEGELQSEQKLIMLGNQNRRETQSQKNALENIKKSLERKKAEAEKKEKQKPVNYNQMKPQQQTPKVLDTMQEQEIDQFADFFMNETEQMAELDNILNQKTSSAIGQFSNMRRFAQDGPVLNPKKKNTRIDQEMII